MNLAIRCEDLHVQLGGQEILRGIWLDIPRGCFLPIVGPNGAGKTTLLKAILGLVPITRGRIVTTEAVFRPAYVPQQKTIDPIFPVSLRQIVEMGLYPRLGWWKQPSLMDRRTVDRVLEKLGLIEHQNKTFGELSGGMKQKTLVARAFVMGAEVLLLDEPTSELDEPTETEILRILQELVKQEGRTVVLVHHGLHQAAALADCLCWIEHGLAALVNAKDLLAKKTPPMAFR